MKKRDLKSLAQLAKKNREASQAAHEAEAGAGAEPDGKKRKHRDTFEEKPAPDPRYEGVERLFTEMKRRDRP